MRSWHALTLALIALLLAACAAPAAPQPEAPAQEPEPPADPCAAIRCGWGNVCVDGQCVCPEDMNRCGEACIAQDACCADTDCGSGEMCKENSCVATPRCSYGQAYNAETGECGCAEGFDWCGDQGKCIPYDSCCDIFDCNPAGGIDRRCIPSEVGVQVCMEEGGVKHCKQARTNTRNGFTLSSGDFDIYIDNVWADGQVDYRLVRRSIETPFANMTLNRRIIFNGVSITPTEIQKFGGNCKNKDTFE